MDYSKKLPDISDLNLGYVRREVEESFEPCPSGGLMLMIGLQRDGQD